MIGLFRAFMILMYALNMQGEQGKGTGRRTPITITSNQMFQKLRNLYYVPRSKNLKTTGNSRDVTLKFLTKKSNVLRIMANI